MAYLPKQGEVWKHQNNTHYLIDAIMNMIDNSDPRPIILCRRIDDSGKPSGEPFAFSADYWEAEHNRAGWYRVYPPMTQQVIEDKKTRVKRRWKSAHKDMLQ